MKNLLPLNDNLILKKEELPQEEIEGLAISSKATKYVSCASDDSSIYFYNPKDEIHTHLPNIIALNLESVIYKIKK